ncbi:MAG: TraR/DksA C4-type zinc finger protein [Actinomycetota bacterium]
MKQKQDANPTEEAGRQPQAAADAATARRLLDQERRRLQDLLRQREQEAHEESEREGFQDQLAAGEENVDVGTDTFEREKSESIRLSIEDRLADIDEAYAKLDKGGYGICEICGRQITGARLEARPETRYCAEDAAKL